METFLQPDEVCSWVLCCGPSVLSFEEIPVDVQRAATELMLGRSRDTLITKKGIVLETDRFSLRCCTCDENICGIRISEKEKHIFMRVFKV
uniref:Uncharacterized protein n=1 Tax=Marseillevirus sp. TaxID=2809551 RepID=A0AA96IXG2_9VIRU|nr:hypothetical protein MarFTMF_117 [Marseillevirus sp.]